MTYAQFLTQFDRVISAYPGTDKVPKFPVVVLERMHMKLDELKVTPPEMRDLCDLILDTCEHAPKTAKVVELANIVLNRTRAKGFEKPPEEKIACAFCGDLRVIFAQDLCDGHETLFLCECTVENPDASDWPLPKWNYRMAQAYLKQPCPLEWFKPEKVWIDQKSEFVASKSFLHLQQAWHARVKAAVKYWAERMPA